MMVSRAQSDSTADELPSSVTGHRGTGQRATS